MPRKLAFFFLLPSFTDDGEPLESVHVYNAVDFEADHLPTSPTAAPSDATPTADSSPGLSYTSRFLYHPPPARPTGLEAPVENYIAYWERYAHLVDGQLKASQQENMENLQQLRAADLKIAKLETEKRDKELEEFRLVQSGRGGLRVSLSKACMQWTGPKQPSI